MTRRVYLAMTLSQLLLIYPDAPGMAQGKHPWFSSIADCISASRDGNHAFLGGWWVSDSPICIHSRPDRGNRKRRSATERDIQAWQFGSLAFFLSEYARSDLNVDFPFDDLPTRFIATFCILGDKLHEIRTEFNPLSTLSQRVGFLHGYSTNGMQIVLNREFDEANEGRDQHREVITLNRAPVRGTTISEKNKWMQDIIARTKHCKRKYSEFSIRECVMDHSKNPSYGFLGVWYFPYILSKILAPKQMVQYGYTEIMQSGSLVVQLDEWAEDSGFTPKMLTLWCERDGKLTSIVEEGNAGMAFAACINQISITGKGWMVEEIGDVYCPDLPWPEDRFCYSSKSEYRRRLIDDFGICHLDDQVTEYRE